MDKSNKTAEAKLDLVKKFLDYAHIANASYAMLNVVNEQFEDIINGKKQKVYGDTQTLGAKLENTETNTTYARAIESRFMKDIILEKGTFKDKTINNDPKKLRNQ